MDLFIGGIHFNIVANSPAPDINRYVGAAYSSFFSPKPSPYTPVDIQVFLNWGKIPSPCKEELLFHSGQSWQMYLRDNTYQLFLHPRGFDSPIWMAEFRHPSGPVRVICREDLDENPFRYPLDQLLSIYILAAHRGILIHSAGVAMPWGGIILAGQSGAGKSTITRQFPRRPGVDILSDDRMIAREWEDSFLVFGTPWPGEEGIARNNCQPLKAILFLRHGSENRVQPLTPQKALEKLMQTTSIPWYDREILDPVLDTCESLVAKIPCFDFFFTPDSGAADFILQGRSFLC